MVKSVIIWMLVFIYRLYNPLRVMIVNYTASMRKYALFGHVENLAFNPKAVCKYPSNIKFGTRVKVGPGVVLGAMSPITIDDDVRISHGVIVETAYLDLSGSIPYKHKSKPIHLKKGVWLATNSMILAGVTIGEYSIVSAGAIVTKDIPDNVIYKKDGSMVEVCR